MIPMRKIKIGAAAVGVVIIAFLIYSSNSEKRTIEKSNDNYDDILQSPDFTNALKIGDSSIGAAGKPDFIITDPVTKKIVRRFGFEKLLTPENNGEKWRLKNPYMLSYGDGFECKITSDEGNFQIEYLMDKPSPQNARLYGNVKLEITFQNEGVPTSGVIYFDDLDYDSEMSKLHTDNSVKAVFEDAVMEGSKMTLIYNAAKSRIEYLDMKQLDYIKIKNLAMLSGDRKQNKANQEGTASNDPAVASAVKAESDTAVKQPKSEPVKLAGADTKPQKNSDYYHCRFLKDVNIVYGDELVVRGHEELNIKNLLLSQSAPDQQDASKPSEDKVEAAKTSGYSPDNAEPVNDDSAAAIDSAVAQALPDETSEQSIEKNAEVVLTCSQGFVVQLMSRTSTVAHSPQPVSSTLADTIIAAMDIREKARLTRKPGASADKGLIYADDYAKNDQLPLVSRSASFAADADLEGTDTENGISKMPTRFHARKIDYDMNTKYAYATGPISLLIYDKPDPNAGPDQPMIPVKITAADNAEYFGQKDQVVFNGQVKGIRKVTGQDYDTENTVNGDQLVVDLDSSANENSIGHISVLGEKVEMFSHRRNTEETLSLTRLKCKRIDYDASDELVTAMGPGVIEIDNSKAPVVDTAEDNTDSKQITLKEPCYALIKDFDSLKWFKRQNKLIADGTSSSVKINHAPVISLDPEPQVGNKTFVAARRIEAGFTTNPQGRTELTELTASNGVSFMEGQGDDITNYFNGDRLFYDVSNSTMLITGTEGALCRVNGFNTDRIVYNLATGELKTNISGPSMIQLPPKPE